MWLFSGGDGNKVLRTCKMPTKQTETKRFWCYSNGNNIDGEIWAKFIPLKLYTLTFIWQQETNGKFSVSVPVLCHSMLFICPKLDIPQMSILLNGIDWELRALHMFIVLQSQYLS